MRKVGIVRVGVCCDPLLVSIWNVAKMYLAKRSIEALQVEVKT